MKATKRNIALGVSSVVLLGSLVAYPLFKQEAIALESPAQTFGIPRANGNSKQSITMMTPLQVSSKLRELEESYLVERGQGVLRYDVAQLPSNSPIEDDRSERIVQVPLITPDD